VTRPDVVINASGVREIDWPRNEFRYGEADTNQDVVTCAGVEPHMRWRCFCDCVSEIVKGAGVRRVVLLGSHLADVIYSQPVQITGVASDPVILENLGVKGSSYQGPTGILGVLGDRFTKDGLEVLSLWAGLPHYINARPNPRGSLALVQVLSEALGFRFDLDPLYRSAAEFEERISKLVAQDPELSDYVKQLKRREFAQ
jgi:predicted ATP-grasp superfamily ATP-dependent carboligase